MTSPSLQHSKLMRVQIIMYEHSIHPLSNYEGYFKFINLGTSEDAKNCRACPDTIMWFSLSVVLQMAAFSEEHVQLKVETAQCKLDLWNPAEITISELGFSVHANKPYTRALEEIVRGDPSRNIRARVAGNVCVSVQEQIDCLLDQATDPNLLGRIFAGWQPWV